VKPIILLGTERSGTNLLRRTLSAHSQIASPPASGLIANMAPYRHKYLSGKVPNGVRSWVLAALALIDAHPSSWEMDFSVDDILARMGEEASHWKLFQVLNTLFAEKHHASYWFSKEPGGLDCAYELLTNLPDAKFIYLIRDGRDVAASMLKGGVHAQHIYEAAEIWKHDQLRGMQYLSDSYMRKKIFLVRYEGFLAAPDEITGSLFDFIGCGHENNVLHAHESASISRHASGSEFWKNLSKPIMADNLGKYKKALSRDQIHLFETVAREQLDFFRYTPEFKGDSSLTYLKKRVMQVHSKFNKRVNMRDDKISSEFKAREKFTAVSRKILLGEPFEISVKKQVGEESHV